MKNLSHLLKVEVCLLTLVFAVFFYFAMSIGYLAVTDADPNHCRESSDNVVSVLLNQGENPYNLKNLPAAFNVYGPFFYIFTSPFSDGFLSARFVQRLLSVGSIFGFAVLFSIVACGRNSSTLDRLIAFSCGLLATFFIFGSNELGSKPGNFGMLLSFACLSIPSLYKYSYKSLCFAVFLGALAILTKMYYAYSPVLLISYVFCFVEKRKAIISAIYFGLIFLFCLAVIEIALPNSTSIVISPKFFFAYSTMLALSRFIEFGTQFWPIVLFLCALLGYMIRRIRQAGYELKPSSLVSILDFRKPLFTFAPPHISLFIFVSLMVIYARTLAGHSGNGMIYVSHTFLPYLCWFLLYAVKYVTADMNNRGKRRDMVYGLLFLALIIQIGLLIGPLSGSHAKYRLSFAEDWTKLQKYLDASKNTLGNRMTSLPEVLSGKSPYEFGQTEFAIIITSIRYPNFRQHVVNYYQAIQKQVAEQKFDLIVLMDAKKAALSKNTFVSAKHVMDNGYVLLTGFPLRVTWYPNDVYLFVRKHEKQKWLDFEQENFAKPKG